MTRLACFSLLVAVLAITSGCDYYLGDDDDDCLYGAEADRAPAVELRNPFNGSCEYEYGGGGGGGGCYEDEEKISDPIDTSDWAMCTSFCTGLDEATCLATGACRGAYIGSCPEGYDCDSTWYDYHECWATAPSGPVSDGECWGLDALACSRHDNCVARHFPVFCAPDELCDPAITVGNFDHCAPEDVDPLPPACDEIVDEGVCIANDCTPLYVGIDCICDASGCSCADWTFTDCQ